MECHRRGLRLHITHDHSICVVTNCVVVTDMISKLSARTTFFRVYLPTTSDWAHIQFFSSTKTRKPSFRLRCRTRGNSSHKNIKFQQDLCNGLTPTEMRNGRVDLFLNRKCMPLKCTPNGRTNVDVFLIVSYQCLEMNGSDFDSSLLVYFM